MFTNVPLPMRVRFVLSVLAALLVPAGAAFADDLQTCYDASGDVAIAACTRAIESGRLSKANLAIAYTSRGVEWRAKGQVDRAIIDHGDAIRTDPTLADAFYNRGNAYKQKGELDRAIADYTAAIRLNPKRGDFFNNRGLTHQDKGDTARSNADLEQAKRLKK